jgi:hypothetical protein
VNGHAFISHGRSNSKAIKNGILRAAESAKTDLSKILEKVLADAQRVMDAHAAKGQLNEK